MATPPPPLPGISPEAPGAPPRKQNTLVWVLSGCGTVLVLGLIVGIIGLRSFMKNHVHIGANGEVDLQVAGMTMHAGKAKDLGIPIYSGADLAHATGMEMNIPAKDRDPLSMSVSVYATKDSVQMVDDWYHKNLSSDFIRQDPSKNQTVLGSKGFSIPVDRGAITYTCERDDIMYLVSIDSTLGKTQIKLARTNPPSVKPQ